LGATVEDVDGWRRRILETLRSEVDGGVKQTKSADAGVERLEVLSFQLGTETYGVEIAEVAEVLPPRTVTPLPRAPSYIRGVVSLRGTILPVVDLARRIGLDSWKEARLSRILVLRDRDERVGFWVDRVAGVIRFSKEEVETTDFSSSVDARFLKGIGYDEKGNLVAVLDGEELCDFGLEVGG
jgi:purine-binding chemotaxis protein CheW